MAIRTWTPADGFTRKPTVIEKPMNRGMPSSASHAVKPTVVEKPKPPVQAKRRKPSERQRAYWLKRNQLEPSEYTVADQYLVKQAKTQTPMVFVGYGRVYACTITKLWRYHVDLSIEGRKKRIHKLALAA